MIKKLHKLKPRFSCARNLLMASIGMFTFNLANAGDIFVNDGSLIGDVFTTAIGNDANPGTAGAPYATIQFAINASVAGDVIYIDAGTYLSGDLFVTKSLSLRGAKFGIPAGPANVPVNRGTNETVIQGSIYYGQSRDNISVDGFTLNVGTALRGIEARGLNSVIINNILTGTATPLVQQAGISTRANSPLRLHSYTISNNNVRGFRFGIYMDGNLENPSEISYNYVTQCVTEGYDFTASNGHHIKANVSENNSQGMVFTEGANLVDQNTIIGNALIGIRLAGTPQLFGNLLVNNFFINNGTAIGLTDPNPSAINNQANFNSFTGNVFNIINSHTANFNAQCNWYNSTDASVIAAQLNGNINFNPFLTDGIDSDPALDGFQPTTSCTVLPIILSDFSASLKNYDVLLKWQTVSEVNSSHFIIERSLDNQLYTGIGRVDAKGFSDTKVNYNFTDNKPVNFDKPTYYRLSMIDRDGSIKKSKIVSVVLKTNGSYVQQVYPNPVKSAGVLTTDFISNSVQTVQVTFTNAIGQVIRSYKLQALKGANELKISVPAQAAPGINFLQVRAEGFVKQIPVYIH
ncbi:MAG: T9SS type A sorting domain-containing protein [Ferruginibacter sp.]|nr:T9SS type A sorting domain-containing protein [Ferruginibacter sp.]